VNLREAVYLITSLVALESAIYVFYLNRRSITNIVYSLLTADFAIISFMLFQISGSPVYDKCQWWYNKSIVSGCLGPSLIFHFSLAISRKKIAEKPAVILLLYIPAIIFMVMMLKYDCLESSFIMTDWGWKTVITAKKNFAYFFILYANILSGAAVITALHWRVRVTDEIDRIHARSIILPYIAGQTGFFLSPYFIYIENHELLTLLCDITGGVLFLIFIIGIRYSINRYSFMKITSMSSASAIINGLSEPSFLIGINGNIIHYNRAAAELMPEKSGEINYFYELFDFPAIIKLMLEEITSGRESRSDVKCGIYLNKKIRSFCISMQSIRNEETGEPKGVLVFLKEDLSINIFREKYGITGRQMEIVSMIISGMTNREIAAQAGLAEKTVENHLFNIYNKLGIDNKIELYNLAREYNIIPN